jgi:hypothetical protein
VTWTWVLLNNGRRHIVKIHPDYVEEAASNEELIPATDGFLVPMVEVDQYGPETIQDA